MGVLAIILIVASAAMMIGSEAVRAIVPPVWAARADQTSGYVMVAGFLCACIAAVQFVWTAVA